MSSSILPRATSIAALALAIGVAACSDDRPIVTEPTGTPAISVSLNRAPRNLPSGTVTFRRPTAANPSADTIIVTLRGLEPLVSGVYQVWLASSNDTVLTNVTPLMGSITEIRTDTTFTAEGDPVSKDTTISVAAGASSFTAGGPRTRIVVRGTPATIGQPIRNFNVVFVTVEAAAGATQPSDSRPLWRIFATTAAFTSQPMFFGRFDPVPANRYVFTPAGRGFASFRENLLIVQDSGLSRPPVGYYYAAYVIVRDTATDAVTDTLFLGEQTTIGPVAQRVSLRDADVSTDFPNNTVLADPPIIIAAGNRVSADTLDLSSPATAPFLGLSEIIVTLENKRGDENTASPSVVLSAPVPEVIFTGRQPR